MSSNFRLPLNCIALALSCVIGCDNVPSSAPSKEKAAIKTLRPLIENVGWSEAGHVWSLDIGGEKTTDAALTQVSQLSKLEELNLIGTSITDDGLARLQDLNSLKALGLQWTAITDEGLAHIPTENLTTLDLMHTAVSDAGIESIEKMLKLERLFVGGTRITQSGFSRLNNSMPECHIQWSDASADQ